MHDEKEDDWVDKPLVDEAVMAQLNDLKDRYIHRPFDYVNAILALLPKERQFKKVGQNEDELSLKEMAHDIFSWIMKI